MFYAYSYSSRIEEDSFLWIDKIQEKTHKKIKKGGIGMSLFRDDFYNTRVSRSGRQGWRSGSGGRRGPVVMLASAAAGIVGTIILLLSFGYLGGHAGGTGQVKDSATSDRGFDWSDRVVQASDRVRPAVVSIITTVNDPKTDGQQGLGLGSGVIFKKSGGKAMVVTNFHVVEGGSSYEVVLSNSSERKKAVVVGGDRYTDLAVLEMDASGIGNVADFGDSDKLKPGETAIAIGNPLGISFAQTTTVGVISSPIRPIPVSIGSSGDTEWEMDVIQTDAAINQGNSGGALVNLDGKVIGINSMKIAQTGVEGLGFAIPINDVKPIIDSLIANHKIKRPKMGVSAQDLQTFTSGLDVLKLPQDVKTGVIVMEATGPAKTAGIQTRDVIVELDGNPIDSMIALRKYLFNNKAIGDQLDVTYYRDGKKEKTSLKLEELDDN
jgi:serine protease Do